MPRITRAARDGNGQAVEAYISAWRPNDWADSGGREDTAVTLELYSNEASSGRSLNHVLYIKRDEALLLARAIHDSAIYYRSDE